MEIVTRTGELTYFLWSMAAGAAVTLLYDFLRARRREKGSGIVSICIEDTLFIASLGLLLYVLAFHEHGGLVRWYSFFGLGLGALLFKLVMGDAVMRVFRRLYALFCTALCLLISALLFPLRLVCRIIRRPIGVVVWHSREGGKELRGVLRSLKTMAAARLRK